MRKSNVRLLSAASAAALSAMTPALAQNAPARDEILVTARMRTESIQDVPLSITAFSEQQILDAQIDQVGDFIALTPNMTIAQSESAGLNAISIRGITQVRNSEAPVAVVVDGVLQVNSRQFTQELFDVSSIEVLRGPQGALYGRNATGGAIIINTKQPTNEFEAYLRGGYATGKEYLVQGGVSGPIVEDKVFFRIGARYLDRKGYFDNLTLGRKADPYEDITVRGMLNWNIAENFTASLRGAISRVDGTSLNFQFQQTVYLPDGITLDPMVGFDFSIPGDADRVDRTFRANNLGVDDREIDEISLKLDYDAGFATLTSITSWNRLSEYTSGDQFPYTAALTTFGSVDGTQTQFTDIEAWSQEVRLTSPSDQHFRWMAGFYYIATDRFISSTTGDDRGLGILEVRRQPFFADASNPTFSFFGDDNENKAWAVFGNAAIDLAEGLEAAFAFRYDKDKRTQFVSPFNTGGSPGAVNAASFDKFQPKVTLNYRPTADLSLYGSWGVGFRSGQFNQNGVGVAAAMAGVDGVEDLVPQEETKTAELGFKSTLFDGRMRLNGALFRTKVENQQYFVFIGAVGAQVLVPIDEVSLYGGEIEAVLRLADGFDAYAAFGVTKSEIDAYSVNPTAVGNKAPYVPETTLNLGGQYRVPLAGAFGLFARADYERRGAQFWDPENSTARSALNLVNLRFGLEGPDGRWSLIGSAENVTDKEYNSEFVIPGFSHPAPPRIWRVDLRYNF